MKHKEIILELRKKGYSYNEIASRLNCSKGTIAYHCGEGVKEKTHQRAQRDRDDDFLFRRACVDWGLQNDKDWFRKGKPTRKKAVEELRGVIKEVYDNKCYLSGRPLDMKWGKNLEFDHIIPKSKGGSNNLDNLGLCTREANGAKQDLSLDELFELCKDILEHNGYKVEKK